MPSGSSVPSLGNLKLQNEESLSLLGSTRDLLSDLYGYPSEWFPARWRCRARDFGLQVAVCTEEGGAILAGILAIRPLHDPVTVLKQILEEEELCSLGIIRQGGVFSAYRYRSKNSDLVALKDLEPYKSLPLGLRPLVLARSSERPGSASLPLEPLTHAVESLFFESYSHIRDIDGLHADEALDELCKVLYAKFFDEEHTSPSQPVSFQYARYGNTAELSTSVRELYRRASGYGSHSSSVGIHKHRRARAVFEEAIRLSAPALARVVKQFERYDISNSKIDIKGRAFQRAFLPAMRSGMGQYFTPHAVVKFVVDAVQPTANDAILDPFCGSGHFLTESMAYVRRTAEPRASQDFSYQQLHGIEKSERMVRVAMTDMRLHGDGHANIRCTDALLPFESYHDIDRESFDLVLTNPPFGSVLGIDAIRSLGEFELAHNRKTVPSELLGLERSLAFLRPGGLLAIVLPESIFANSSTKYVRDWISTKGDVRAIISLPIETFTPFGANIKTSVLFCQKHRQSPTVLEPVVCGVIDNIGHDSAGRVINGSDIASLTERLRESPMRRHP